MRLNILDQMPLWFDLGLPELSRLPAWLRYQYALFHFKQQVQRERRALAEMSAQQLADLGLSPEQAYMESQRTDTQLPRARLGSLQRRLGWF